MAVVAAGASNVASPEVTMPPESFEEVPAGPSAGSAGAFSVSSLSSLRFPYSNSVVEVRPAKYLDLLYPTRGEKEFSIEICFENENARQR